MSFTANLPVMGPVRTQTVTVAAASAAITNAVGDGIRVVRLVSTTDCHIAIGAAPVATAADLFLPANCIEHLVAHPGQKVAAIQNAAGGVLYVTEMSK